MNDQTNLVALLNELKKYGAGAPTKDDVQALETELYDGSDRAAGVVLGALAENAITHLLRQRMGEESVDANFGTKIDMACSRKLFGDRTKQELTIIRHLRNQFAHSQKPIEFVTPVVKQCCDELTYPDAPGVIIPLGYLNKVSDHRLKDAADKFHPRTRYFVSVHEIISRIYVFRTGDTSDPINQLL